MASADHLSAGAPTGNRTRGFGAGKATWDLSGYAATQLARVGPYLNVGVSNNVSVAREAQSGGAGPGRPAPAGASGNLVHAETGVEVDLGKSIYVTGSVYGIFASSPAAPTATPATPRRGPRGRLLPPRPAGGAQAVATDDVSDHGVGGVLWAQVTASLDLGVWITHSVAWDNYTTVSISANISLSQLRRTPRSHQ